MPHVLVAGKIHPAGIELLRSAPGFTVELISPVSVDSYAPFLPQADALLIRTQPLTAVEIASARQLKIVSRHGVGYDSVDIAALSARHIPLAVVGDVNSRSVAEHTLALLLALAKRVCYFDQAIRAGDWNSRNTFSAVELAERTLFILGFGRIGREVARLAQAFRMKVVAWDPYVADSAFADLGVARVRDIDAGLQQADAVTIHLPRVGDRPLIGRAELVLLKPGALIINTARGGIIDEDALAGALAANHLGGAALDVLECEPADLASALLEQKERLILTPHSAGLTGEAAMRMSVSAAQNIIDYFNECLEPSLVVNPEVLAINAVMNPLP
ncbi:TPA: hydroxyacid dehydrogenase [Raoultella planticola]|uniref:hydroxyacid dehydrogenase n=1 Tax=Raoultella planticola TaxID=575 RepID=UPI0004E3D7B5|nr:hydroxyacid dehydrogenase [Raoultella planticola]ELT9608592.1 hydroxyacid dehydrogenase [Raoultella planticola]KFD03471.1 D-3-phosphoglycerate dehydrogenase [Raoultella planticola ATCC 33531]MBZ7829957.1 hydroxyacid dehydrogenase [Raoultella planticola]VTM71961.1 D-3-phosphoglycerate dehydrogenase [Raoultella planticola]HAT1632675.1 hydroxyacid dehydrogenase [Raoultella planticola]